jgi:hypothetical protein
MSGERKQRHNESEGWEELSLTPPVPQPLADGIHLVGLWDIHGALSEQRRVSVRVISGQLWKDVVQHRHKRGARVVPMRPPKRRRRCLPISRIVIRASPLACLTLRAGPVKTLGFAEYM